MIPLFIAFAFLWTHQARTVSNKNFFKELDEIPKIERIQEIQEVSGNRKLSDIREPEKLYEKKIFIDTPQACTPYTLNGTVEPFGLEFMPRKWSGSSSTFGREIRSNCHAEAPKKVKWGRDSVEIGLYSSYQRFKENEWEGIPKSGYAGPSYVIEAEINHYHYNFVLVSYNGILMEDRWPRYKHYDIYYPKTWGILIFDNKTGILLQNYSYMSPEQLQALDTGKTRDVAQSGSEQVIELTILLSGPLDFNHPRVALTLEERVAMNLIKPQTIKERLEHVESYMDSITSRRLLQADLVSVKSRESYEFEFHGTHAPNLSDSMKKQLCTSVRNVLLQTAKVHNSDFDTQSDVVKDRDRLFLWNGIQFRELRRAEVCTQIYK